MEKELRAAAYCVIKSGATRGRNALKMMVSGDIFRFARDAPSVR